jgi:hypothetical protein
MSKSKSFLSYYEFRDKFLSGKFPGFDYCIKMLHSRDPQIQEDGFGLLRKQASEYVEELISEFKNEKDHGLRCWLLELIGEARSPVAFPLLVECLNSEDLSFKYWAVRGLKNLDSEEARQVLLEAKPILLNLVGETQNIKQALEDKTK